MNSGSHRGFTVVTIITLVFAPVFEHHHWLDRLVSQTSETSVVACAAQKPCPAHQTIVNVVRPPLPADPAKDDKPPKQQH